MKMDSPQIMYIEGVGAFKSEESPEMFSILPESINEVSYDPDPDWPRYIIKLVKIRGGPETYLQYNTESKKDRIILVGGLGVLSEDYQNVWIDRVASHESFNLMTVKLFDNDKIIDLYQAQQKLKQCAKEVAIIEESIGLGTY
ncbi:Hypothetical protein POVR1_LOCUS9 [uncultured virus]|nr:Hypothetical protein POVR1_LOCUS9 [uncultured virus]